MPPNASCGISLASTVWEELSRLRRANVMCDVIFVAMDKTHIHAHGCVLAASSSFLKQTLNSHAGRPGFCIELPCLTGQAIDSMLHFIYTGHLELEPSEINKVKVTAKALQIVSLIKACTLLAERRLEMDKPQLDATNISHPKATLHSLQDNNHKSANSQEISDNLPNSPQIISDDLPNSPQIISDDLSNSPEIIGENLPEYRQEPNSTSVENVLENTDLCDKERTVILDTSEIEDSQFSCYTSDLLNTPCASSTVLNDTDNKKIKSDPRDEEQEATRNNLPNEARQIGTYNSSQSDGYLHVAMDTNQSSEITATFSRMSEVVETGETCTQDTALNPGQAGSPLALNTTHNSSVVKEENCPSVLCEEKENPEITCQDLATSDQTCPNLVENPGDLSSLLSTTESNTSSSLPNLILTKDSSTESEASEGTGLEEALEAGEELEESILDPTTGQDSVLDTSTGQSTGSCTDQALEGRESQGEGLESSEVTGDCVTGNHENTHTSQTTENLMTPAITEEEICYTGEISDGGLLFTEEVAMETDGVTSNLTFAEVIGSESIVEVASGYEAGVKEETGGCQGQLEPGISLIACDGLSVEKEEEWMEEGRSEVMVDTTTQYVALELKVDNEGGEGTSSRTALVTIPVGQDGVIEKEALQAMFNQTALSELEKDSEVNLSYHCELCEEKFPTVQALRQHIVKAKHQPTPGFVCTECGQKFKYKHNLKNHQLRHLEVKPFVCKHESCGKQFASKNDLIVHGRSHTGARPYACDYCSKAFTQSSNLLTHKRSVHNQEFLGGARNYSCPECHKSFKTKDMLSKHTKRHQLTFTCSQCDIKFRTRRDLKTHGLDTHNMQDFLPAREDGERVELYQCPQCDRVFMDTTRLQEHVTIVHNKEKRFSCPWSGCQYTAYYKYNIQRHYKVHETASEVQADGESVYRCEHCTAPFTSTAGLRMHLKSIHPEETCRSSSELTDLQISIKLEEDSTEDYVKNSPEISENHGNGTASDFQVDTKVKLEEQLHTTRLKDVYICSECTQTFTQKPHLQRHLVACHGKGTC